MGLDRIPALVAENPNTMNPLYQQATQVQRFLQDAGVSFAIIGGLANALYGRPRATLDADILVLLLDEEIEDFLESLQSVARVLPADPAAFAREMRVIPCQFNDGLRVDFILVGLDYESTVIRRAVEVSVRDDLKLRVCAAEDLIILKMVSTRVKDREDVVGIVDRQGSRLDREYIVQWLSHFEKALDRSDLVSGFRKLTRQGI
ncbi:MAG: nucleotidyltransferase [bacterium]